MEKGERLWGADRQIRRIVRTQEHAGVCRRCGVINARKRLVIRRGSEERAGACIFSNT